MDPLAENFPNFTPYHYVHNNPINLIDPTGMAAVPPTEGEFANGYVYTDSDGSWTYNDGVWGDNSGGGNDFAEGINFSVKGSDSSKMAGLIADFTGGSQAVQTHLEAQELSANSNVTTDWRGYAAYTLMQEKATNPGGLEIGRNLFGKSPTAVKGTTTTLASYYPVNGGAMGSWSQKTLSVGARIDRYGASYGKYFSPEGTPLQMRALPPGNTNVLTKYQVMKSFNVQPSTIAPAFNQVGTGVQYYSPFLNAGELVKGGYLMPIK